MSGTSHGRHVAFFLALCTLISSRALAQQPSSTIDSEHAVRLEEVIVTAQRRTEDLQAVPISVQVVGAQTLAEQNFNSVNTLTEVLPAVHVGTGTFSNDIYIRGIGSGNNPSFDQSVAMFIDDVYYGRSRTTEAAFLDLDRIEILKGPQSTFFGNNAIAGALNIVTKKPGSTFDAWGRALYGQFGQYAVEGAVGLPITNDLGIRVAVTRNGQDGWSRYFDTGERAPVENNEAARITIAYHPSSDLDITMKVQSSLNKTAGSPGEPGQWVNCPPPAPLPISYNSCNLALDAGIPIGLNGSYTAGLPNQGFELSTFDDVLTVRYSRWGHEFTSVTGFTSFHFNSRLDLNHLPVIQEDTSGIVPEGYRQFSQEFRVTSPSDQPLRYMFGGYFQTDHLNWDAEANLPALTPLLQSLGVPSQYLPVAFENQFSHQEHVYSVFGSLNWSVTSVLNLSAGIRGSWVNNDFTGDVPIGTSKQIYGGLTPVPADVQAIDELIFGSSGSQRLGRQDKSWMPSAGAQYQLNPDAMIYFSYSKGFKAGGYNGVTPLLPAGTIQYGPEHVNAYELGIKSKWLDDRLLLNFDVFRSNYQDLQAQAIYCFAQICSNYVKNAAASVAQGIELETQWLATRDLRFSASVTYLDSHYTNYPNAPQTTLQTFCAGSYALPACSIYPNPVPSSADYSGVPTNFAPRLSGLIRGTYTAPLPGGYKLIGELSPFFSTRSNEQDPYMVGTAGYLRIDARLSLESPDGHWALDIIGKNLSDRVIVDTYGAVNFVSKEEPRNVAAQVRYHY